MDTSKLLYIHNFKLLDEKYPSNMNEISTNDVSLWNQIRVMNNLLPVDDIFNDDDLNLNQSELRILTWKWFPDINNREKYFIITDINSWPGDNERGALFIDNEVIAINTDTTIDGGRSIDDGSENNGELIEKFNKSFQHLRMIQITEDIDNKFICLPEFNLMNVKRVNHMNLDSYEHNLWSKFIKYYCNNKEDEDELKNVIDEQNEIITVIYWNWCPSIISLDSENNDHKIYELIEFISSPGGNEIGGIFLFDDMIFEINDQKIYNIHDELNDIDSISKLLISRLKCINHLHTHRCIYSEDNDDNDKYNPKGKIKDYCHTHRELINTKLSQEY